MAMKAPAKRSEWWPLMPPAPDDEDDDPPHLRTTFLVITVLLGVGVSVALALPFAFVALAAGCGLIGGVLWHIGGRMGPGIAALLVTSFANSLLRPFLNDSYGPLTAGLVALLPGMAGFAGVVLVVRFIEARQEQGLDS